MDIPLRTKLQASFLGVALLGAAWTGVVAWLLIGRLHNLALSPAALLLGSLIPGILFALFIGNYLSTRLSGRIKLLAGAAEELEHGNLEARVPEPERAELDEIRRLQVTFNEMAQALQQRDEELRETNRRLEAVTAELQRWNSDYLSTLEFITHELKNQVASAKLNVLALLQGYIGELSDEQREALSDVVQTVGRTEDMLLNYLNLSRIEKGELHIRTRPVRVGSEVVAPVLRDLRPRLEAREMTVTVDLPESLVTQADPTLLQTVYENLLTNAAKYGRAGGNIRIWGRPDNGMLEMHVWNEGEGVAPDQLDLLFGKFCRLAPPGEEARGTGLGLFIDREIVRKHGGEIRAESKYGEWIDFIFTLPRPDEMLQPRSSAIT